jgi:RNA polymerase sigma-70 factor (ECF subfamily)
MEFEDFMRINGPRVYTLSVRLTGHTADGRDLAQETFIQAYRHFSEFREDSGASTWLHRICLNTWKNRVRYEKRRDFWRRLSTDTSESAHTRELPSSERVLGSSLERSYYQSLVQSALKRLDAEDRAILVLRDMEDRSYEEIAEILDIPLDTVKSRLARGRDRLRQQLEPHLKDLS